MTRWLCCAYLDPGTGSYLTQVLLGLVLGAAMAIKACWKRCATFLATRLQPRGPSPRDHH